MEKINDGLCECGCGEPTPIAKRTDRKIGHIKGESIRFILGHANKNKPSKRIIKEANWYKPNNNNGYCECGCGLLAPISSKSDKRAGYLKDHPKRFYTRHGNGWRKDNPVSSRDKIFTRDDWTCQECSRRGCELHAHHIKEFSIYIDLRYIVENGITLCKECHMKLHGLNKGGGVACLVN